MKLQARVLAALTVLSFLTIPVVAADWPGFLGPNRDGHSPDKGLLKQWPDGGPPLLWKVSDIGPGWSSVAVVGDRIYTTGNAGGKQMLICLDAGGKTVWRVAQGPEARHRKYAGARSTPTVDGDRIYLTGGNGLVTCHSTKDGKILWKTDMKRDMRGKVGGWLYAESVLIHGDLAIVTPGGPSAIVALNKMTGKPVWGSDKSAQAGYSSCIPITEGGKTIIANGSQSGMIFVDAKTGKEVYRHNFAAPNTANCPTFAYVDGFLFWSVGYGKGSVCLKVANNGGRWTFRQAWTSGDMGSHPGNYVVTGGKVYGKGRSGLVCLDLATGKTVWKQRIGSGQVCTADGMLYSFADRGGEISLVDPTGAKKGSFRVAGTGSSWSHPVVINGRMYLRYDTNLYCYDVKAK